MQVKNILDILNYHGLNVDLYDESVNVIIIYDYDYIIDEVLDEVFHGLYEYEIIKYDSDYPESYVKFYNLTIDKESIESYKDLRMYLYEYSIYNTLLHNSERDQIIKDSVGMNQLMNYDIKFYNENKSIYSFNFNHEGVDPIFFYNLMNLFDYDISEDIVVYDDILDFNKIEYSENYADFNFDLFNDEFIIIDYKSNMIKNLNDELLYELFLNLFDELIGLSTKIINYDVLIEILNIISFDFKIIQQENKLLKVTYDYNDYLDIYGVNHKKFIDEFNEGTGPDISIYSEPVTYEEVDGLFDYGNLYDFIVNHVDPDSAYSNYDNFKNLFNIIWSVRK